MNRLICSLALLLYFHAASGQTARQLRSWEQTVSRGLDGGATELRWDELERRQIAFIRACGALGDYHLSRFENGLEKSPDEAMRYYSKVIYLSNGTDSDLGDNNAFYERNKICRKVAALFNNWQLPIDSLRSPYVGHYVDASRFRLNNSAAGSLRSSPLTISFLAGNTTLTADAKRALYMALQPVVADSARIVISGGARNSLLGQQLSWSQVDAAMWYAINTLQISRERFLFRYGSDEAERDGVVLRLARPGETGSPTLPPPFIWAIDDAWLTRPKLPVEASSPEERRRLHKLERRVRKGLPGYDRHRDERRREQGQIAFINACGELGDYYANRFRTGLEKDLKAAMRYYEQVIYLTTHVDSDLGDNNSYKARNRVCRSVAKLYTDGLLPVDGLRSKFTGHYVDVSGMQLQPGQPTGFKSSDTLSIFFLTGSAGLSADAWPMLQLLAKAAGSAKLVILTGGERRELDYMTTWERVTAVADALVDQCGVDRTRIIMQYGAEGVDFNHCLIRLAGEGEEGPSQLPPPMGGVWDEL